MSTTPTLDEFRAEVTEFLDRHAERKPDAQTSAWGEGDDDVAMFEEVDPEIERGRLAEAKAWRATRYDAGLGYITGPAEYGGRELPPSYGQLYSSLEARYAVPDQTYFGIGLGMVAPTIKDHAQPHIKARYLPALHRADLVACQLFSEPGAGSDLAGLQTRAERDGDEWIVTGQKVWTSGAHYSDIGEVICRTDPDQPKHQGLTGFVVDMHAPGVDVRPLRQMTGGASFNEVFFNEVRVPDDHRLGDVNNGWNVALTTLMNERAAIGAGGGGGGGGLYGRVIEMTRAFGLTDDLITRQMLVDLIIHQRVANYNNQRAMDKIKAGGLPGPEMSMAKLAGTMNMRRMSDYVSHVLGAKLVADTGEWGTYSWGQLVLGGPGGRIAGGTDEVMRNIVGERVLGLPKDPGIDSNSPFKDLKVGTQAS